MSSSLREDPNRAHESTDHEQYTLDDDEALSVSLVEAIAAVEDEDPTTVDVHLPDHLDPIALDAFYANSRTGCDDDWTLELTIDEFDVTVRSDGEILING